MLHTSNISITHDLDGPLMSIQLSFSHLRPDEDAEEQRSSLEQKLVGISFGWLPRLVSFRASKIEEMNRMDLIFAPLALSRT